MGAIKLKKMYAENDQVQPEAVADSSFAEDVTEVAEKQQWEDPAVLKEFSEKTDKISRHYKLNNGTAKSIISATASNYFDEAEQKWKPIDNSLSEKQETYESKCGKYKTEISKPEKAKSIKMTASGVEISWEYLGKQNSSEPETFAFEGDPVPTTLSVDASINGALQSKGSRAVYENADKDIDIEYDLSGNNVKENIIIKEKAEEYKYLFALKTQGLKLRVSEDNESLELYTETVNESGETEIKTEATIPTPFMYDANGESSDDVYFELAPETDGKYTFAVVASAEWINAADRALPVIIDPRIETEGVEFITKKVEYRTISTTSSGSSISPWYSVSSSYIKVQRSSSTEYKTTLTIKKSNMDLLEYPISSVTMILKPYRISSQGYCYINNTSIYLSNTAEKRIPVTSAFKNAVGDFTIEVKPRSTYTVNAEFYYSGAHAPVIEIEYLTNGKSKIVKQQLTLAGGAGGEYNVSTGDFSAHFADVSSADSVLGFGIAHVYKKSGEDFHFGKNIRLNLNETLSKTGASALDADYVYTDANGEKQGFKDTYYYINGSGNKTAVDKEMVTVDLNGELSYTTGGITYEVQKEQRTKTGLTAITKLEGFKGAELVEQRIDEQIQVEEQLANIKQGLKEYVSCNISDGTLIKEAKNYLEDFDSFLNINENQMILPLNDYIQFSSALLQIEESDSQNIGQGKYVSSSTFNSSEDYSDGELDEKRFSLTKYSKYLSDLRHLVRDLRADYATLTKKSDYGSSKSSYQYDEYYKYLQENNIKEGLDTKICTFEGASTDFTYILQAFSSVISQIEEYYGKNHAHLKEGYCDLKSEIESINNWLDDYYASKEDDEGEVVKVLRNAQRDRQESFEVPFANRVEKLQANINKFEQEINDFVNEETIKLYRLQIEFYRNCREYHLNNAKKYYKEYVNLQYQADMYVRQTPINYLTDGKIYKGFNEEGNLVAVFDKYDNTMTIEYDEDGKIVRVYDGEEKQITFDYRPDGLLGSITDTRGRRTVYDYNTSGYLNKICYANGETLALTFSGDNLSVIKSSDHTMSTFTYTGTTKIAIATKSGASLIKKEGVTEITAESEWVQTDLVTLTHTDHLTTIESENGDAKYYKIDDDGNVYEYYEEEEGKVVAAERYDYVVYEKDNVQYAKRSSLYSKGYASFTSSDFGSEYDNTQLDDLDNPSESTSVREIIKSADGVLTTQTTVTTYEYNDDHKCVKESAEVTIKQGTSVLQTYTQVTAYNYNASGDVVRKESYVEGEEYTTGKTIEETVYDEKGNAIKSFTYNSLDSSSKFYTESDYAENGQVLADYDETGENKTEYEYISGTNVVRSEKYPNGSKFAYGHDVDDTVTSITQSTEEGEENSTHTRYTCGEVTELVSGNNKVNYEYDGKRRVTKVSLNDVEYLTSLNTDTNDGEKRVVKFAARGEDNKCDQYEVNKNKRGDIVSVGYAYEDKNATGEFAELYANEYDLKHRLVTVRQGDTVLESNEYDDYDRQTKHTFGVHVHETEYNGYGQTSKDTIKFGNDAEDKLEYVYAYDDEKASRLLAGITVGGFSENYEQDVLSRALKITQAMGGKTYTKQYGYYKTGDHATSRVNTIYYGKEGITDGKVTYTYDCMGNIVSVNENGKQRYKYAYDKIGRLILEKDLYKGKEVCYTYDNNGNILTKSIDGEVTEYRYKEGTDRLVSFGTESIAYDNMGNPTTYKGMSCTWEKGRQLKSIEDASNRIEYEYDVKGIRTAKKIYTPKDATEPAQTTSYIYENGKLLRQITGDEVMTFVYGSEGVMGFNLSGSTEETNGNYLYRKNLFGDITGIMNESGAVVYEYTYSAFGKSDKDEETGIGAKNPFRYRGYCYDDETGLYYLKSRYYDPEVGRFITIDDISYLDPETINGLNLYSYCANNPITNIDSWGTSWWSRFWRGVGNWFSDVGSAIWNGVKTAAMAVGDFFVTYGAAIGAGLLAVGALAVGIVGSIFTGGLLGAVILGAGVGFFAGVTSNMSQQVSQNGWAHMDFGAAMKSGGIGAAIGALSGVVSYGFGTIGAFYGQMAGNALSSMTIAGLNVGKVFAYLGGSALFSALGSGAGYILGSLLGTAMGNKLISNFFGINPSTQENITEGINGLTLDGIIKFFKLIFRR